MFCSGFHEAKYDFRAIQNYSENKGMRWALQDKQGTPEFIFSENAFQCFEEFLGRARSSDARQFHMNNCCFTAGFRAPSPSTLSFADNLGGKSVFVSSTCLNANAMTRGDACGGASAGAVRATPPAWKSTNIQIITTSAAASSGRQRTGLLVAAGISRN